MDEVTTLWTLIGIMSTFTFLTICLCCICRRRNEERKKKKHFARLVNDLNAEEKFTLVTPSDDDGSD